jgi:hypothetical protein
MSTSRFEQKWDVCLASIPLWTENSDDFSFESAAAASGVPLETIQELFDEPEAIPRFFYEAALALYHEQRDATDGFDAFTLNEKLVHFACSLFDIFDSQKAFVQKSLYPLVLDADDDAFFKKPVSTLFKRFVDGDDRVSSISKMWTPDLVYDFWAYEFGHVLRFWLRDSSENKEKTLALLDKLSSFVQELFYNTAADRGIDLAKCLWQEGVFKAPFGLDSWMRK